MDSRGSTGVFYALAEGATRRAALDVLSYRALGTTLFAALLLGAGPVTALPLIWFASAARRLRLATVGLWGYGEPFTHAHVVALACIWSALALYSLESWRALR